MSDIADIPLEKLYVYVEMMRQYRCPLIVGGEVYFLGDIAYAIRERQQLDRKGASPK